MNQAQIQKILALISVAQSLGFAVAGNVRKFLDAIHPGHDLTDGQINAIEQASADDSARRLAERIAMAEPSQADGQA